MYNRLTLVDNLSHREALAKIYDDHKHLSGFSRRNIRRNLPLDNVTVPRRIRPSWPKNSITEGDEASGLSNAIQEQNQNTLVNNNSEESFVGEPHPCYDQGRVSESSITASHTSPQTTEGTWSMDKSPCEDCSARDIRIKELEYGNRVLGKRCHLQSRSNTNLVLQLTSQIKYINELLLNVTTAINYEDDYVSQADVNSSPYSPG